MMAADNDRISALLAECADMLLSGASIAACLDRYPDAAADLEPLLLSLIHI